MKNQAVGNANSIDYYSKYDNRCVVNRTPWIWTPYQVYTPFKSVGAIPVGRSFFVGSLNFHPLTHLDWLFRNYSERIASIYIEI